MGILEGLMMVSIGLFAVLVMLGFYFLPTIIAFAMHNHNLVAILLLNTFTGWSGVGWVAALIWAVII